MKLKTRKSLAKRVKLTGVKKGNRWGKTAKMTHKAGGQDHFNARESGKVTRKKRRDKTVGSTNELNIRRALPYL